MAIRLTDSDWISLSSHEISIIRASLEGAEDMVRSGDASCEDPEKFLREVRLLIEFFSPHMDRAG